MSAVRFETFERKDLIDRLVVIMTLKSLLLLCILLGLVSASTSLSILLLSSITSTSHHIWAMALVKGLLQRGHHVHVVSIHEANIKGDLAQNLTYDVFEDVMKEARETDTNNFVKLSKDSKDIIYFAYYVYYWGIESCERIIQTKAAEKLLEAVKRNEYDVIVQDVTLHQCMYGLWQVAKGKPPVVGFLPFASAPWMNHYTNSPRYPNVRPYVYTVFKPTTVWERTWNVLYYIIDDIIRYFYLMPTSQRLAEQYIGHEIRPLYELEKNISIMLINSHFTFDGEIPLPPNAIEIGGLNAQTQSPVGLETRDFENVLKFLDAAENGAIVISLGTNVNWEHIGLDKLKIVISALSKLKQHVLWKLDIDVSFTMPDNVMTVKWIPQNDVLNHKNVKAIWIHGGLLSTHEAIWKGIPVVATPFIGDQMYNINNLVDKGAGILLDFEKLSTQSVLNALEEIIHNKSYMENMKRLSNEFRDRSVPPLDLAVWSIEYAARNPNKSLASPLKSECWIKQNLIDVYAILFLVLIITLLAIFFALKMLCSYLCKSIAPKSPKSKQM